MFKIFDLHNDFFTNAKYAKNPSLYLNNIKKTDKIASVIWSTEFNCTQALNEICKAKNFTQENPNTFLAIEDLHFLTQQTLNKLISYKPYYCGLTWNYNNNLAGGAYDNGSLTTFGKHIVKNLENNNIFVDCAHLNEQSFMDLSKITTMPMLCSHTASFQKNNHPRNLKDSQIEIITQSGGLIGVCLVNDFLTTNKQCCFDDYILHLNYLVCKFGINHFAIGTDFCGTEHLPIGVKDYESFLFLLISSLQKLGYKELDINKLLFKNAFNFFKKYKKT